MIFEFAHHMGAVPLVWLGLLRLRGRDPGVAWWYLAGAFFASWLADTAAHWVDPRVASPLYLITQSAIVGAVFLDRREAVVLLGALVGAALVTTFGIGFEGPDVLLHTVAWGSTAGIVWGLPQIGRLRTSLLVTFGLGLLAWYGYALRPGWASWGIYQSTRLLGILLFCWAAIDPVPHFKLLIRKRHLADTKQAFLS